MKPITLYTDDFDTIKKLANRGELLSLKIDWIRTIFTWNFMFKCRFQYKP